MDYQDYLTNEELKKKFKSQFELVRYAISLAENMIQSGRESRVDSDIDNRAMQILEEISEGVDQFDDIPKAPVVKEEVAVTITEKSFKEMDEGSGKSPEKRKKPRKILAH
jgi:DNA-directed RNA polymerase subunit K/omega